MDFLYYFSPLDQFNFKIISVKVFCSYSTIAFYCNTIISTLFIIFFFLFVYLFKKKFFFFFLNVYFNSIFNFISSVNKDFIILKKKQFILYYLLTFIVILTSNLMGLFPYSFAITGHLFFTFFLSLSFFYGLFIIVFRFKNIFFFSYFCPAGVPFILLPFLIVIELASFLARLFSLPIRLFANIMSGHMLIKVLSQFSWILLSSSFYYFNLFFLFIICFIIIILIFFLEAAVAFIQSYIFMVLQTIYLGEIIS